MIEYGADTKKFPKKYKKMLEDKTMLMIFTKPSLRTRISFQRKKLRSNSGRQPETEHPGRCLE